MPCNPFLQTFPSDVWKCSRDRCVCEPLAVTSISRRLSVSARPLGIVTFSSLPSHYFLHTSRRCRYVLIRTQCPHGLHSFEMVLIEFTMIVVEGADLPASEVSLSVGDSVPMTLTSSPR